MASVDLSKTLAGAEGLGIQPVTFTNIPLALPESPLMLVAHGIDATRGSSVKLIYQFKNVSVKDMYRMGKVLNFLVKELGYSTSYASAGPSPVYRNQWDFIYCDVPLINVPFVQELVLKRIKAEYSL